MVYSDPSLNFRLESHRQIQHPVSVGVRNGSDLL